MNEDLVRRLRAADPAAHVGLVANDAMREAIMTTDVTTDGTAPATRRRRLRRAVVSGGLATVLVGGGAAYAGINGEWFDWYRGGGGHEGPTCMLTWDSTEDERTGGPWLTGDAVEDCRRYQELTGRAPIEDPVAFRVDGDRGTYVAPRSEVPPGATTLGLDPQELALTELEASMNDYVDGLGAQCLDAPGAVAAAEAELARLGLDDWTVRVDERPDGWPEEDCAGVSFAWERTTREVVDGPDVTPPPGEPYQEEAMAPRTLAVVPGVRADRDRLRGDGVVELVYTLRDTLRSQIAEACVDLGTAERIAAEAIGAEHHWPTVVVEDPGAQCTRVDLTVNGSLQVSLRGPRR